MQYALTSAQMREAEHEAIERGFATLADLMDRAGRTLADEVLRVAPEGAVVVVCGKGNNGGDGWVAAQRLTASGRDARVMALVSPRDLSGEARAAADAAVAAGVAWHTPGSPLDAVEYLTQAAVILDCVFGFGFRGVAEEPFASAISAMDDAGAFVIAADVPSGVAADTGRADGPSVRADVTVTFSATKPGLLIYPGASLAGEIVVADIGVPREILDAHGELEIWDAGDLRAAFPHPRPDDHKGSRGRVLVVAGSVMYAGAAVLTAEGALRMGAGYVYSAVSEQVAPLVHASLPSVIVRRLPVSEDGSLAGPEAVLEAAADVDAVVVGPGLGLSSGVAEVVLALIAHSAQPLVLDADALNVLAARGLDALFTREAPVVITPHPGEMGRLLGTTTDAVEEDRVAAVERFDGPARACLLKGAHTVVAGEGRRSIVLAGNAGLAKAGSGDVLAGMLGTLLAQGLSPFEAATLGAYLHGRAAEHGADALTETCFTSVDIVAFLPDAVHGLLGG